MKEFLIDGIVVKTNQEDCIRETAEKYLEYANKIKEYPEAKIKTIKFIVNDTNTDGNITIDYVQDKPKIERIRRITG